MLKHGVIVEEGSHDQLLNLEGGYYKRLWDKQSEQQERQAREKEEQEQARRDLEEAYERRKRA